MVDVERETFDELKRMAARQSKVGPKKSSVSAVARALIESGLKDRHRRK
jgi:hypothetical protein